MELSAMDNFELFDFVQYKERENVVGIVVEVKTAVRVDFGSEKTPPLWYYRRDLRNVNKSFVANHEP